MLVYVVCLLSQLPASTPRTDLSCNSTIGELTRRKGPPCILPYRLDGELRYECTTSFQPQGQSLPKNLVGRPLCPIKGVSPLTLESPVSLQSWAPCSSSCLLVDYRTNKQMWQDLESLASTFPRISRTFVLGTSVEGRPLLGINIGTRRELTPRVRLYSGLAGDQTTGRELLTHLATHLIHSYGRDDRITSLLDTTFISIVPAANPDGFIRARKGSCSGTRRKDGERNAADVSLETDFPTPSNWLRFQTDLSYDPYRGRQPETEALMNWSVDEPWILGLHLQDGMVGVTYPFHGKDQFGSDTRPAPDSGEMEYLGQTLLKRRGQQGRCYFRSPGGVSRGAKFQRKYKGKVGGGVGSLEDFTYMFTPSLEIRMGVSCCKYPYSFALSKEWETMKDSLLDFLEEAQRGVKGVVYLPDNTPAVGADILLWGPEGQPNGRNGSSSLQGEYFRYLLPSSRAYTLQAVLDDCEGTGIRFASPQLRVLISSTKPVVTQLIELRRVGVCRPNRGSNQFIDEFDIFGP